MAASETAYSCPYTSKCRAVVSFLQLVHACLISEAPSQALVSPIQKKGGCICRASGLYPGRRKAFLPRFVVGFSAQGGSTWFFAELAGALAALAGDELDENNIIPKAFDPRVGPAVAKAVAEAARKSGVARI